MSQPNYHLKPQNVGGETYFFEGTNGVEITNVNNEVYTVYPISSGNFFTGEVAQGYERIYFFIKWFSSANPITTADVSSASGTVTFSASPDPLGVGSRRYKTVSNGNFNISDTDDEDRTIPAASGPMTHLRLNISAVPVGATHFMAWAVKY